MPKRPIPVEFGQEVRRLRLARGWTLYNLAKRSSLTPNYIGAVEMGKRDPSLSTVLALAKGLEVSTAELFEPAIKLSPEAEEVGLLYQSMSHKLRDGVRRLLSAMTMKSRP